MDRSHPKHHTRFGASMEDPVGSVTTVVSGPSRLLMSSAQELDFRSRKATTIRPDATVLIADAGIANITFMAVFRFNEATAAGMIFATQVIRTYVMPCLHNSFHNALDDGIFRRPITVKTSASIS